MRDVLSVLDQIGVAALVVDDEGEIKAWSAQAARAWPDLCPATLPLDEAEAEALRRLARAARAARDAGQAIDATPLPRVRGRPLVVQSAAAIEGTAPAHVLLVCVDPENVREPSAAFLRAAFGLSPSETALAVQLCLGRSLKEISRLRTTSVATLRVQLRTVFIKTRTRRQAELVALLARSPSPAPHPHPAAERAARRPRLPGPDTRPGRPGAGAAT